MRGTRLRPLFAGSRPAPDTLAPCPLGLEVTAEPAALEEQVVHLFEQHRGSVYRYLVAAFGRPADAEEITQEAFLALYHVLRDGGQVTHVRAWLFRVAHNLAVNRLAREQTTAHGDEAFWADLAERVGDAAPTPETQAMTRERERAFHRGLQQLSRQQRQCLLLRVEGLRYREIAEVLEISVSTVAELLRRGLRKLTRTLHD